jgi:hypothetical protein
LILQQPANAMYFQIFSFCNSVHMLADWLVDIMTLVLAGRDLEYYAKAEHRFGIPFAFMLCG